MEEDECSGVFAQSEAVGFGIRTLAVRRDQGYEGQEERGASHNINGGAALDGNRVVDGPGKTIL